MKRLHVGCRPGLVLLVTGLVLALAALSAEGQTNSRPRQAPVRGNNPQTPKGDAQRRSGPPVQQQRRGESDYQRLADQRANGRAVANEAPVDQHAIPYIEPQMPLWMPISQKHQDYINKLLTAWEARSAGIKRYQCEFQRFKYDLGFDQSTGEVIRDTRGKEAASEISNGIIKFNQPDKALFQTIDKESINLLNITSNRRIGPWQFDLASREYKEISLEEVGEHWICDGENFFEFNYRQKILRKLPIPEEVRGEAIARGPLPFLFKAKANDISNRFWLRIVTPQDEKEAHHLEATPKTMEDAAQFGRVIIILDSKEFLPKALIIFPVGSKAPDNRPPPPPNQAPPIEPPTRELFIFNERKVNPVLDRIKAPKVPGGWQMVVEPLLGGAAVEAGQEEIFDEDIAPDAAVNSQREARRRQP